jgi:hypothetical protein
VALVGLEAAGQSRAQAESFARKVAAIQEHGAFAGASRPPRRTTVSEAEVNSWFLFDAPPLLPDGLAQPRLTLLGNRRVVGTAIVDLDAVARSRATGRTFDIWNFIGGRVPVTVTGVLHLERGQGRFDVQTAEISGVAVPLRVLEELVQYYSRTPDDPTGIRLTDTFELPAGITQVELRPGSAVVVQ